MEQIFLIIENSKDARLSKIKNVTRLQFKRVVEVATIYESMKNYSTQIKRFLK